jgi:hypothetical protein
MVCQISGHHLAEIKNTATCDREEREREREREREERDTDMTKLELGSFDLRLFLDSMRSSMGCIACWSDLL